MYMKEVVEEALKSKDGLTSDENNLLNAGFKNPICFKRR
jgi:hypothetical protein